MILLRSYPSFLLLALPGLVLGNLNDTTHDFIVDLIQGDSSSASGNCTVDVAAFLGDKVIYNAQQFFMEQNIVLTENVTIIVDESQPGVAVDTDEILGRSAGDDLPSAVPSASPSALPSGAPTSTPTAAPTMPPTSSPTGSPTQSPTVSPTGFPTTSPTVSPTPSPTGSPTGSPTAGASYCCTLDHFSCHPDPYCNESEAKCNECSEYGGWIIAGGCPADGLKRWDTCTNNVNGCCPGLECVGGASFKQCLRPGTSADTTTTTTTTNIRTVVANQDFDGTNQNLLSGFTPTSDNWDGGSRRFFGVGSLDPWPVPNGIPFTIVDSTLKNLTGYGLKADDKDGVFGQGRDTGDKFFAIADITNMVDASATWEFDVGGYEDLEISVDMGGISDVTSNYWGTSFGYAMDTDIRFTVDVDGCQEDVFILTPVDGSLFDTRPMDIGHESGGGTLLKVSGLNPVTKLKAEDLSLAANQYLDKSVASGTNAGQLDTFTTFINCPAGATLKLTVDAAKLDNESIVFDNIKITGIPDPNSPFARRRLSESTQVEFVESSEIAHARGRTLYQSYWFTRYSASGSMSCSHCSTANSDADHYWRHRKLSSRSLHSEYESYMSFHLTRDVRDFLTSNGLQCLGPVADIEVYFALTA